MAVHIYWGPRERAALVYGGDLVLLRRWAQQQDRTAVFSGLYPDSGGARPAAVVLTDADEVEFQARWSGWAASTPEKFERYLQAGAGTDATGHPFQHVDVAAASPWTSPWRDYVRAGEVLVAPKRLAERYGRLGGRESVIGSLLAGPRVRLTALIVASVLVGLGLLVTVASRPLALLGVLPALALMYYLRRKDAARPESLSTLVRAGLLGAAAVVPIMLVGVVVSVAAPDELSVAGALFGAFVLAALIEELGKAGCLRTFRWHPEFDERFDGMVYGAWIGLGFALVENVLYLASAPTAGAYLTTFVGRAVLAVPGHAIWGGLIGYAITRRRFDGDGPGLVGGLALAIVLHGLYDAGPFLGIALAEDGAAAGTQVALGLGGPVLLTAVGVVLFWRCAKAARAADDAEALRMATPSPPGR